MNQYFMERAIELAGKGEGWTNPNPLVGAVIVKDGRIIGEGWHERIGGPHAERNALKNCKEDPAGADLYVTLEPCCHHGKTPPCTEAVIDAGIRRVFLGNLDPNPKVSGHGAEILRNHGIQVKPGVMERECRELNEIFFHYITTKMPWTAMKYAMTLDGKIATSAGESKWITGIEARNHVHRLRHRCHAVMTGIGTVLADDPMLNARIEHGNNPIRVICDSKLKIPLDSKIVKTADQISTVIATVSKDREKCRRLEEEGLEILHTDSNEGKVDIRQVMRELGRREIDSVLAEGGGILNESLMKNRCVHKVYAYIAPKLFGGSKAKTPVEGEGIAKIQNALFLKNLKITTLGEDILLEGGVKECLPGL